MAEELDQKIPALKETLAAAESRLAALKKENADRYSWLINNVPNINSRSSSPATRARFAAQLFTTVDAQPLELAASSAAQLVQQQRMQLAELTQLKQLVEDELKLAGDEEKADKERVELLKQLQALRLTEGEMRQDERLAEKLEAASRKFKQHRKWLVSMIEDLFEEDDEMRTLLQELTGAYFKEGDSYISAINEEGVISPSLAALFACKAVMRHPYQPNMVRLQDLN